MKHRTLINHITALLFGLLILAVGAAGVFAETEEPVVTDPVVTEEPVYTIPVTEPTIVTEQPIVTDPPTEPSTAPVTEATSQVRTTTVPQETTQAPETTQAQTENDGIIHDDPQTTEFIPPTIPKTVSEKSYTTNVAAGIISWICVLVGLIVIFAVAVSTKLSAYRAGRRV